MLSSVAILYKVTMIIVMSYNDMISLKSKITIKILEVFFLNEKERFYINEMARRIGEDLSNVYKKLLELKGEGLLLDDNQGKERYFFLNQKYPLLKEYKKIFLKSIGFEETLKKELRKIKGIDSAYLFGSYATGRFSRESDIDILIIGDIDLNEIQKSFLEIQKITGREINSIELTKKDFKKRLRKKDALLEDIFSKKHIRLL